MVSLQWGGPCGWELRGSVASTLLSAGYKNTPQTCLTKQNKKESVGSPLKKLRLRLASGLAGSSSFRAVVSLFSFSIFQLCFPLCVKLTLSVQEALKMTGTTGSYPPGTAMLIE